MGFHQNPFKLLGPTQAAAQGQHGIQLLSGGRGVLAQLARGQLDVLRSNRCGDVAGGDPKGLQLVGVQPNAHRVFGAKEVGLAHPLDPSQLIEHGGGGKAAQGHGALAVVLGGQDHKHQVIALRLGDGHAQAAHIVGQTCLDTLVSVLRLHRGDVDVGASLKRQGQRAGPQFGGGLHVEQAFDAVHFLLDERGHGLLDHLGRSARVGDVERDGGLRHLRVLSHRHLAQGQHPRQDDEDGDHPCKDGAVDEEFGQHVISPPGPPV